MSGLTCERCGRLRAAAVEAMPVCSMKYRLLDADLCYGHDTALCHATAQASHAG